MFTKKSKREDVAWATSIIMIVLTMDNGVDQCHRAVGTVL